MTINEMSSEFDILYNQVNSNQSASLDEYEKSVFLTKAQDELIKAYFDPRGNKFVEGFDAGAKRQYDFSLLIKNIELQTTDSVAPYDPRGLVYIMPDDVFLSLNESVVEYQGNHDSKKGFIYQILPITYDLYMALMQKPYQYPTKKQVWRLITNQILHDEDTGYQGSGTDNSGTSQGTGGSSEGGTRSVNSTTKLCTCCEIIGRFNNMANPDIAYKIRYVMKPTPIILVNLSQDNLYNSLSIEGKFGNEENIAVKLDSSGNEVIYDGTGTPIGIPCKLPVGVHHEIVQRAVELATATYNPQAVNTITGIGNVSSTNLGIVPRQESK